MEGAQRISEAYKLIQEQLADKEQKLADKEQELTDTKQLLEDCKDKLARKERVLDDTTRIYKDVRDRSRRFHELNMILDKEVKDTIKTADAKQTEVDRLKQELRASKEKSQKQEREILRLQQSAKTIMDGAANDKASGRQKARVKKLEKTIAELTEKNQKLEARNAKLEREFKEVVNESADRWHKIRAMKMDHDMARIRAEKTVAEMGEVMRASVCCIVHLLIITNRSSR